MSYEVRPARADEMEQIGLMSAYVYGGSFGDEADNITATSIRPEWTLCAFDGPRLITSFGAFPFTMRANGSAIAFAGVTAVGTLPEYRRQGLLRRIMTQAIADQREQGQSVSGLWASQAAIYQRYGYAAAGTLRNYAIDTVDIRFADGDGGNCRVERVSGGQGIEFARQIYKRFIADRFGYLHRSSILWQNNIYDTESDGPVHTAVAYREGEPQGYVAYTLRSNKVNHVSRNQEIIIRDFGWLDIDAYRSLWTFLSQHDLVGRVAWASAPMDDPAMLLMQEPRLLHCNDREGSWMRIIDVPAALAQRGYDGEGDLVIGVRGDDFAVWNNGNWRIRCDGNEAEVSSVKSDADVELSIGALTSLYTGMCSTQQLSSAGLISVDSAVTTGELDRLFATRYKPHCPDHY